MPCEEAHCAGAIQCLPSPDARAQDFAEIAHAELFVRWYTDACEKVGSCATRGVYARDTRFEMASSSTALLQLHTTFWFARVSQFFEKRQIKADLSKIDTGC